MYHFNRDFKMNKLKTIFLFSIFLCFSVTAFAEDDNETCLSCHDDSELTGINFHGEEVLMYVTSDSTDVSVHADMMCIDCHVDLEGVDDYPHEEVLELVDCAGCHDDVAEVFDASAHGKVQHNELTPNCASCHGKHTIRSSDDADATTSKHNLSFTCANCHEKKMLSTDPDIKLSSTSGRYMKGIHAKRLAEGVETAATCNDCHGVHDLKRVSHSDSKVNKMNVPKTCAKCHQATYVKYSRGIHGKALAAGILDSPNCADCHGEHEILGIHDVDSPVNYAQLSDYVCGKCHNDDRLTAKYGLGKDRFTTYQDTYHGLAIKGGSIKAATCASCHNAHDILPSTNPASSLHLDNRTQTCQTCHPDANDAFAASYTHMAESGEYGQLNYLIKVIYILLIIVVIGGMLAHNAIIFIRYMIMRSRYLKTQKSVKRLNGNLVFQHIIITVTFIVLVLTGFALKFPNAWWVESLKFVGMFESARGLIHRISAVAMIYISIHHVVYIMATKDGRTKIIKMLPAWSDLKEIKQNMMYYLGLSKEKAQFGYFDYTMKAEYWALAWGTFVMVFTGTVLWFPTFYTTYFPPWIVSVSETIHHYEAWLAMLAIGVFHFFFVIFHPDQYPMSFTWLNGDMPEDEIKHHHPRWYKELQDEEAAKESKKTDES